ncbi:MAG: DUF4760 domain-containing protein [Candidatus Acidiferrum sp.]
MKWLGETIGFWIQNLILTISAVAGIWVIKSSKTQEKRRATIDVIMYQKSDAALQAARKVVLKLHESGECNFAKYLENTASEEYKSILLVLNGYEFIASGIREGAFDKKTYKRLRYSTVLRDWGNLCAFVLAFRRSKKIDELFQEFEWLNEEWKDSPLKPYKKGWRLF